MRPDLRAFREVRVSDPVVTPDATSSTYTFVTLDGARHEVALKWKYGSVVYGESPGEALRNQARLHHSIPSINYGLFAERIVLDFPLTEADLRYHRMMQDVTAREQYLTRFVRDEPHPLILPAFHVPPDAFEPDAVRALAPIVCDVVDPPRDAPPTDPDRYAVLSSGGKESLFTYGLLRELGEDVAPVYVNESGRHWHTAVTSHRHHAATEPRTRRIWTTVDRLYVAANRLLPFVRPDFQRVAADVYPIQLFTFNSYQMAVAGLALSEGIGTLLMGNEFDEGPWPEVKGVRHYHGIYDQSQEFDALLTAFYQEKGWSLRQTSLVRSLTSLVIQDLLASRYPDLFATQTSCHATHVKDGVVRPCGRCSKCLGVMLFLVATGHDPTALRYASADVAALGARLARTVVKVEQAEAEHAMWLAQQRGWRFEGSANGFEPRAHPEVQSIRFHPEMSRPESMPDALAERAYAVYRTRATGGVSGLT